MEEKRFYEPGTVLDKITRLSTNASKRHAAIENSLGKKSPEQSNDERGN